MPFSAAIFLASGEALIRLPVVVAGTTGAETTSGAGSGATGAGAGASATGVASGSGETTAGVLFSAAGASSPASPTAAMAPPTGDLVSDAAVLFD